MKPSDVDISVIVPVYNVADYIEDCLRSVMAQDCCDTIHIECIIVDDRGSDDSMYIVENILKDYSGEIDFRIVVREKNGGLSAARNSGIEKARGKYLYFLDSDDFISVSCLSTMYEYLRKHPDVNIVFGKTECYPDARIRQSYLDFGAKGAADYCDEIELIQQVYCDFPEIACNKLICSEWLRQHGLYFLPGVLHEDFHWHLLSMKYICSYACVLDGGATYMYRQRDNSIMSNTGDEKWLKNMFLIYKDISAHSFEWSPKILKKFCIVYFDLLAGCGGDKVPRDCCSQLVDDILRNGRFGQRVRMMLLYLKWAGNSARPLIANFIMP